MTETFRCGDEAGLVALAYQDGEPHELALIAAHVDRCPACREILAGFAGTREVLAAWTPPDARLGFRVTAEPSASATPDGGFVVAPLPARPWWQQPLPAWAQAAAAAAIFAIGLWAGGVAGRSPGSEGAAARSAGPGTSTAAQSARPESSTAAQSAGRESTALAELRRTVASLEARAPGAAQSDADLRAVLAALDARVVRAEQRAANAEAAVRLVGAGQGVRTATQGVTAQMLRQAIEQSEVRQSFSLAQRLDAHSREQAERLESRDEQIRSSVDERVTGLAAGMIRLASTGPR